MARFQKAGTVVWEAGGRVPSPGGIRETPRGDMRPKTVVVDEVTRRGDWGLETGNFLLPQPPDVVCYDRSRRGDEAEGAGGLRFEDRWGLGQPPQGSVNEFQTKGQDPSP